MLSDEELKEMRRIWSAFIRGKPDSPFVAPSQADIDYQMGHNSVPCTGCASEHVYVNCVDNCPVIGQVQESAAVMILGYVRCFGCDSQASAVLDLFPFFENAPTYDLPVCDHHRKVINEANNLKRSHLVRCHMCEGTAGYSNEPTYLLLCTKHHLKIKATADKPSVSVEF